MAYSVTMGLEKISNNAELSDAINGRISRRSVRILFNVSNSRIKSSVGDLPIGQTFLRQVLAEDLKRQLLMLCYLRRLFLLF